MPDFTHLDENGKARMVDVSAKPVTDRTALAGAVITMNPDTFRKVMENTTRKGNVLETARIAGIMAAKKTSDLIPMCHPLHINHIQVDFYPDPEAHAIRIAAGVRVHDRTGVEMEALTAASVAALTIYDMCKSHDREMVIADIRLLRKSGGNSGEFMRAGGLPIHEGAN